MKKMAGLSLIELLVSLAVGVILMTGVTQVFVAAKTSYSTQQALARVQENSRFLLELIGKDLRNIGYSGCGSTADKLNTSGNFTNMLNGGTDLILDFDDTVSAINNHNGNTINLGFNNTSITPKSGTDVLIFKSVGDLGVQIKTGTHTSDANLQIENTGVVPDGCTTPNGTKADMLSGICPGDVLIVSDCEKSVLFQATNVVTNSEIVVHSSAGGGITPGNHTPNWPKSLSFADGAEILKVSSGALFIKNDTNGRPALFSRTLSNPTEDVLLIGDVEDMQIQFGVDTSVGATNDGTPDTYQLPNDVVDTKKIVSIQLSFLLSSPEPALQQQQTILFDNFDGNTANDTVNTSDLRLRQVVTVTIAIRNRLAKL